MSEPRSVWPTLVGATAVVLVGHWLMLWGLFISEGETDALLTPWLVGAGLAVMALAVVVAAVSSGNTKEAGVAAVAVGAALSLVLWLFLSSEVPLPAVIGGLALAAALGVRRRPGHALWVRILMAGVILGYVLWVTEFSAAFAVIVAPLLPFPTVGLSDFASEREVSRRGATGYAARK